MKNRIWNYVVNGIVISHTIAFIIYWFESAVRGVNGEFYPMVPGMVERFGNGLTAILVQNILLTVFGVVIGVAGLLYEYEAWSLMKRTIVHFVLLIGMFLSVGLTLLWIPADLVSVLQILLPFFIIYVVVWFVMYGKILREIRKMNQKIEK